MGTVPLPDDLLREAARLYAEPPFPSQREVAERLHISPTSVRKALRLHGVRPRKKSWGNRFRATSARTIDAYLKLVEEGLTHEEIGERFGKSQGAVTQALLKAGIRSKEPPDDKLRTARDLRAQGLSYQKIGDHMGIPMRTIAGWFYKYAERMKNLD